VAQGSESLYQEEKHAVSIGPNEDVGREILERDRWCIRIGLGLQYTNMGYLSV